MTCVIGTRRTSAPKRTRVQLLNIVGKISSRTPIFRFDDGDGRRAQVKIKVARR